MFGKLKSSLSASVLVAGLCIAGSAAAVPISYAGDLTDGTLFSNSGLTGTDRTSPLTWDVGNLWTISVNAGDVVTVTARRTSDVDPMIAYWDGVETDTSAYTDAHQDSANTTYFGGADDELPANMSGSAGWGDPQLTFTAATTGIYTIGVFAFGGPAGLPYSYTVQSTGATGATGAISPVPLPASMPLMLVALAGTGLAARRRQRR